MFYHIPNSSSSDYLLANSDILKKHSGVLERTIYPLLALFSLVHIELVIERIKKEKKNLVAKKFLEGGGVVDKLTKGR